MENGRGGRATTAPVVVFPASSGPDPVGLVKRLAGMSVSRTFGQPVEPTMCSPAKSREATILTP